MSMIGSWINMELCNEPTALSGEFPSRCLAI